MLGEPQAGNYRRVKPRINCGSILKRKVVLWFVWSGHPCPHPCLLISSVHHHHDTILCLTTVVLLIAHLLQLSSSLRFRLLPQQQTAHTQVLHLPTNLSPAHVLCCATGQSSETEEECEPLPLPAASVSVLLQIQHPALGGCSPAAAISSTDHSRGQSSYQG